VLESGGIAYYTILYPFLWIVASQLITLEMICIDAQGILGPSIVCPIIYRQPLAIEMAW